MEENVDIELLEALAYVIYAACLASCYLAATCKSGCTVSAS